MRPNIGLKHGVGQWECNTHPNKMEMFESKKCTVPSFSTWILTNEDFKVGIQTRNKSLAHSKLDLENTIEKLDMMLKSFQQKLQNGIFYILNFIKYFLILKL
jgi:hypothetical protein